jgi:hypothetical protein
MLLTLLQTDPPRLSALGWAFMIASNLFVWGMALVCFKRVLAPPLVEPPAPVKEFHSA